MGCNWANSGESGVFRCVGRVPGGHDLSRLVTLPGIASCGARHDGRSAFGDGRVLHACHFGPAVETTPL